MNIAMICIIIVVMFIIGITMVVISTASIYTYTPII